MFPLGPICERFFLNRFWSRIVQGTGGTKGTAPHRRPIRVSCTAGAPRTTIGSTQRRWTNLFIALTYMSLIPALELALGPNTRVL